MPSPFPGMDPFLEMAAWPDFHTAFNTEMRRQLSTRLRPRYFVRLEQRVYVERFDTGWMSWQPDLVVTRETSPVRGTGSTQPAVLDVEHDQRPDERDYGQQQRPLPQAARPAAQAERKALDAEAADHLVEVPEQRRRPGRPRTAE